MASWEDDKRLGNPPPESNPYSEMPVFQDYSTPEEPSPPAESEVTKTPSPAPSRVPVENIRGWFKTAVGALKVSPGDYIIAQVLVMVLTLATCGLLIGPLMAGYYRWAGKRLRGEAAEHKELFSALSAGSFVPTFVAGLGGIAVSILVGSALSIVGTSLGYVPTVGWLFQGIFALMEALVLAAVWGLWGFFPALIHERGQSLEQAWKNLLSLVQSDWLGAALAGVAIGVGPLLGTIAVLLGVLIGGPIGILVGIQAFQTLFVPGSGLTPSGTPQQS